MRPGEFKKMMPTEPKVRMRKCIIKTCRKQFPQRSMSHKACSPECAAEYAKLEREKKDRQDRQKGLQALKTKRDYVKEAQIAFNAYVRLRDSNQTCISCGASFNDGVLGGGMDCGHWRSVGSAPHLRFHEDNAHGQCKKCNRYDSGRAVDYRIGLIARIGLSRVERLESDNSIKKWTIEELMQIRDHYRLKLKKLKEGK
jgi:hypothetical protein